MEVAVQTENTTLIVMVEKEELTLVARSSGIPVCVCDLKILTSVEAPVQELQKL